MANFTLGEMVQSSTAERLGIPNNPPAQVRVNITETIRLLECVRAEWAEYCERRSLGTPAIRITSGYRSAELNRAVGGKSTSAHLYGYAADLQPVNGRQDEFERFMANEFSKMGYAYDQIIIERSKTARWVHVGYKRADGKQRRQCFTLKVK
jgi:hypothetical protein